MKVHGYAINPKAKYEYVYKPTRCTKILAIILYFPLDALHVSGYIIPNSGATL